MENKDKFVSKPLMATIRESVAKDVEAVSRKLSYLYDLNKSQEDPDGVHHDQQFMNIERFFITKDNISKLFEDAQEVMSIPISDLLVEGDPRRTDTNHYELRGKAYANLSGEYLYTDTEDGIKDFTIPSKMSHGSSVTKELAEQINHGILVIDFQIDETNAVGYIVMSGQGLKALKEPHPIVYRMLTSDPKGDLIYAPDYKSIWEPEEHVEFKQKVDSGLLWEPKGNKEDTITRVENLYCWKYEDRHGELELDTSHGKGIHVNEDGITVQNKRICRDRKDLDLDIGPDNTRCLVSDLLRELTADKLL
jgi:hypothetical protein